MTVADAITLLQTMPPDAEIFEHKGVELYPVLGFKLIKAYVGRSGGMYTSVQSPSDWNKTKVVKICLKR